MLLDMKPYYYLLERGVEPVEAYRRTAEQIMRNIEMRTWYRGNKLGDAGEDKVLRSRAGGWLAGCLRGRGGGSRGRRWGVVAAQSSRPGSRVSPTALENCLAWTDGPESPNPRLVVCRWLRWR